MGVSVQVVKPVGARREKVYAAWTQPDLLVQWWGPDAQAEVDLRVGGRFRLSMMLRVGRLVATGLYREIVPNQRLVFSWSWEEGGGEVNETLVTVEFRTVDGETEVVVTHEGNPNEQVAQNHASGWSHCEDRLVALGPALDREIRFETYIAASPRRVWRAVESQEAMRRWLGKLTEFEPGLGGLVRVFDSTGEYVMGGQVIEWVPGVRMTFTWEQFAPTTHPATHFTFELIPEGEGTRVVLRHHRFESVAQQEYEEYNQGWGDGTAQLKGIAAIALEAA